MVPTIAWTAILAEEELPPIRAFAAASGDCDTTSSSTAVLTGAKEPSARPYTTLIPSRTAGRKLDASAESPPGLWLRPCTLPTRQWGSDVREAVTGHPTGQRQRQRGRPGRPGGAELPGRNCDGQQRVTGWLPGRSLPRGGPIWAGGVFCVPN